MAKHAAPESVRQDAKTRALRTLLQGVGSAAIVAALVAICDQVLRMTQAEMVSSAWWVATGGLALQAGLTAAASWLQRRLEGRRETAPDSGGDDVSRVTF